MYIDEFILSKIYSIFKADLLITKDYMYLGVVANEDKNMMKILKIEKK